MKSSLRLLTSAIIVAGGAAAAYLVSEPAINRWRSEAKKTTAAATQESSGQADSAQDGQGDQEAKGSGSGLKQVLAANIAVDPTGDQQLLQAIARLEQRESVTARIRQEAHVGEIPFYGVGTYRQQGRGTKRHVRWLLQSQRDGVHATLLQVSDGRVLWTDQNLATGRQIERVDLWSLRRQAKKAAAMAMSSEADQGDSAPLAPQLTTSYGGLPLLLESLREHFEFTAPKSFLLGERPVIGMVGRWRPESLAAILVDTSDVAESELTSQVLRQRLEEQLAHGSLPAYMPHHVLLLFGQRDHFPYVIDYRSAGDQLSGPDVAPAGLFQLSSQPLSRLEFSDVAFNQTIDTSEFIYTAPDAEWTDRTSDYIERMQHRRRVRIARENGERMAKGFDHGRR